MCRVRRRAIVDRTRIILWEGHGEGHELCSKGRKHWLGSQHGSLLARHARDRETRTRRESPRAARMASVSAGTIDAGFGR